MPRKKDGHKGDIRQPPEPKRLDLQRTQSAEEVIALLSSVYDRGVIRNAKGYTETWNGFKLHIDVNDCGLPLSAVLTSASVHDSQVAIPLMKLTSDKVDYCHDLIDAAYDATQLWEQSRDLGHVPIFDRNPRRKEAIPMAPHKANRYNERTASERCNSRLKEEFGDRSIMVRGPQKVMMHLMFGMITLFCRTAAQNNWLLIVKDQKSDSVGVVRPDFKNRHNKSLILAIFLKTEVKLTSPQTSCLY